MVWQQQRPGREKLAMNRKPEEARHGNEDHNDQGTALHNALLTFNVLTKSSVQMSDNIRPLFNNEYTNLKTQMQTCSGRT